MSHRPSDVEELCKVARAAGAQVDIWDYGFGAGCWFEKGKGLVIAKVYREDRDGYVGGKIVKRDLLDEWLASNREISL